MTRLAAYLVANIFAVLLVSTIATRWISYDSAAAVLIFAVVLAVINYFIKPVLKFLTFPLTCLTFGIFALILNAILFGVAARLTPGLSVALWGALLGSIVASLASGVIYSVVDEK